MWYDILVVGILLYAVFRGATKGIVWQLATIAALVLCFAFSESLSLSMAPYITLDPPLNRWVAMFAIYIFFSFISFAVARWLKNWIDKAQFVEYDRHLGSVFGFVKGVIFVLVMTFFGVTLTQRVPGLRKAIFDSKTGHIAAVIMDRLHPVMPDEFHDVLEPYIHSLDRPGLELHAHNEHDEDQDRHDHSQEGQDVDPIEAPPFPLSPRGPGIEAPPFEAPPFEAPPFDEFTGRETNESGQGTEPGFFDSLFPPSSLPDRPTDNAIRPANGTRENPTNLRAERDKLLREVANVLADNPVAQQTIIDEIEKSLSSLPDQIKLNVVKDWYTDLLVFDPSADPDRETDLSTPFDTRILRQLQLNNVPLSSLSSALQNRLRNSRQ